jgi:hypothetical protein
VLFVQHVLPCTSPSLHDACCPLGHDTEHPLHTSLPRALQADGGPMGTTTGAGG